MEGPSPEAIDVFVYLRSQKVTTWRVVRVHPSRKLTFHDVVTKFLAIIKSEHPDIPASYFDMNDGMEFSICTQNDDEVPDLDEPLIPNSEIIVDQLPLETDPDSEFPQIGCNKALELKQRADALYSQNYISAAITLYELSGQVGFKSLVQCLFEQKQWNELVMLHSEMERMAPNDVDLLYTFGCAYEALGQRTAAECFKKAITTDHFGIFAHFSRLFMEMEKPDLPTALIMLKRAMQFQAVNDSYILKRWCQYFCLAGQFDQAFEIAFQNRKVMKYLCSLMKTNSTVQAAFLRAIPALKAEPHELAKIAEILYEKGCVQEALLLCQEHRGSLLVARIFLLILFNEGLYKGFHEVSVSCGRSMLINEYVRDLQLTTAVSDYIGFLTGKRDCNGLNVGWMPPCSAVTERGNVILDIISIFFVFLFCAGYPFSLDPQAFPVSAKLPFWQLRQAYEVLRTVVPLMKGTDMRHGGSVLAFNVIGDECAIYCSYRKWHGIRLVPHVVLGLSVRDLRSDQKNGRKHSFWNQIEMIDPSESAGIILILGNRDCEFEIPDMVNKGQISEPDCGLEVLANVYAYVVKKIHVRWPEERIIVHPAIPREAKTAPLVYEFNSHLKRVLNDPCVEVIDMFNDLEPRQVVIDGSDLKNYKVRLSNYLRGHT